MNLINHSTEYRAGDTLGANNPQVEVLK